MKTSDILESLGYDKYGTRKKDKDSKDVGLPANKDTAKRDTSVFESLGYNPDGTKKGSENAERTTFQTVPEIVIPRRTQSVTDAQSSLTARKNYAEKIKTGSIAPVQPSRDNHASDSFMRTNALNAGGTPYKKNRADTTIEAALEGVGSGYTGALATLMDAAETVEKKYRTAKARAQLPATHIDEEREFLGHNFSPAEAQAKNEEAIRHMRGLSDDLASRSQTHSDQAKSDLGTIGSVAVDLGLTGTQMLTDAGAAALTGGGSALVPMAMRVFGQGSQEAYRSGASIGKQMGYGAASAAVEVLTEKMWGGLAGLYGKGFGDDFVKGAVKEVTEKITSRPAGQALLMLLADMGGEGMEEVLSGLANPLIQTIYNGKTFGQSWNDGIDHSEIMYEGLVGALLGGIGGTVELPGNLSDARTVAAGKAIDEFYNTAANYGLYSEEARISLANAEDKLARSDGRRISIRPQVIRPDEREATGDPLYDAALSAERAQQQPIEQIEQETTKSAEEAIRAAAERASEIEQEKAKPIENKPSGNTIKTPVMPVATSETHDTAPVKERMPQQTKEEKPSMTKKADWPSSDVEWTVPGRKRPIAYSTQATSHSIGVMADEHPSDTIAELQNRFVYGPDEKIVLQQYIDSGYGDTVASSFFNYSGRTPGGSVQTQNENISEETHANIEKDGTNETKHGIIKKEETAPKETETQSVTSPQASLADAVDSTFLSGGTAFTSKQLFELADQAYGGTMAGGAYTVKDAYDAVELAVNKRLLSLAKDANGNAQAAIGSISTFEQLLSALPTQTKRTEEQQAYQQFSTPPNIAYIAAWAANIDKSDTVLEPSAGIGGLAVFPKAWGASVAVNELSERRLAFLENMGFDRVFNENAEQINNVLPDDVKPSVVLMNPPFSSTAGRTATNKTQNATLHIEQALLRLNDGGRLVAILGRGMSDKSATFGKWWDKLRQKYTIRANIGIDGTNYKKYGTTFDVQLVVIDKAGPQTGKTITGTFKTLENIPKALEGIRNDRQRVERSNDAVVGSSISKPVGKRNPVDRGTGSVSDRSVDGAGGNSTVNKPAGTVQSPARRNAGLRGGNTQAVQSDTGSQNGSELRNGAGAVSSPVHERTEQLPADRLEPKPAQPGLNQQRKKASKSDNGIYAEYVPSELPIKGAVKHPAPLVESAAMAAVSSPVATYKPNLPGELIKGGGLSSAQLENIVYAGQAHQQTLPDGTRKGYFIGDGTGVGKGRQISGIILDNMRQGRKKAIWVSKNLNLLSDAQRDWADIGQSKDDIASQASFKVGSPISMDNGILFTGYDTLRSGKGNDTRISQIVDWVGKDFDGVIAFDEAHNMGNLLGKKGARGMTKGSSKAMAGVDLQRMLPNARIVYVSATGATDVNELAYSERLGLWGRGTAFNDVNDFVAKIGSSGIAAMELVARDMKAMGSYLARSISYDGVTYDTLQHTLSPMQTEIYNTMSHAWQITMQNINAALDVTNAKMNPQARSAARSAYYGAMQRFYNQVLTSMSMPTVIEDIKKELAADHSCVLQIVNTNAAEQERQLAKIKERGGDLDDMDLTPRGTLIGYLENSFPVYAYETWTDEDGKERSRIVVDSNGEPVIDKEALAMRDRLIAQVNEMSIPDGPLEMLFDAFGVEAVAEVTGRGRRVVPKQDEKGRTVRIEERRTKNHTEADIQAFQDGKKRILVFSDAGGTGKSYHADIRAKNQQKRIHYLVQPGWSASTATQGFGRSHRSNQATTPQFKLVTTNIMGQKRFVSTIARRLDQLGALTKGQRETGSGMFTEKDNLESTLARDSLRLFYERLGKNRIEGVDGLDVLAKLGLTEKFTDEYGNFRIMDENAARDMNTFLNRILALEVDEQNTVFDEFYRIFESQYDKALENGTLDRGMESVKADKIEIVDDKIIRTDEGTGATTNYVQAKTFRKPLLITSVGRLAEYRSDFQGLYTTDTGDVRAVYRVADKTSAGGKVNKMYRMQSPVAGKYGTWSEDTLLERAKKLDKKEWAAAWKNEVSKAPEYDEFTVHMLTGTLLPVWDRLPQEGNTRAMRITADDGTQYLGRVIPADQIDSVLRQLGAAGRTHETFGAKDVARRVMNGETAKLTRDHQAITRKRVSGEYRMEITGKNLWYLPRNYPDVIIEYISYENRYFIPTGEKGEAVLSALIKDNPVLEINSGDVSYLISTDTSKQSIPSAKTSINSGKLPVLFSKVKFNSGTVNLDIGGGKFDNATEHLANQGIASYIYDPYNRTDEHNKMAAAATQDGQSDTVTISNVLNVIKEQDARNEVLQNAVDAVKQDGTVYITVYTGDGKGVGRISKTEDGTASCWQENRATVTYVKEVSKYFKNVTLKNGVIIAKSPNKALVGSDGNKQKAINNFASVSEAAEIWGGYRMRNDRADGKWSTGRVGDSDKKPLPISDIVSKIRHDFGIPIVTGHIRGQMILGQYNNRTGGIRTKIANDLPTVSHELGHRIDSLFGVTEELSQLMQDELTSSMSAALKRRYTNNELVSEGFAEFVRKYLQNRETASIDYPNFTAHFREAVDKESLDMIHTFADDINAYYSLDTETAQSSIRLRDEGPADFRTAGEKLADAGDMVYQAWVDSLHGIKLFDRATGANTYYRASNSAYADSMAYAILTKDLTDINGQKIGEGLTAALRGINTRNKKEYAAFGEYLAVKHGPERLAEGQRIFADDRKNSTVWMNNRQRQLENEYPEFAAASERLYEFERNFDTAWLVNTGLVSADTAKEWAERWDFYVPLNRSVGKKSLIGAKRGFANQNSTVKRARGSGLDIVNPVDSIINNIVLRVNAGTRNDVMRVITDAASTLDDTAKFIEKIPTPMKRTGFSMAGVKDQLMEGIIASGMSEKDTSEAIDIVQGLEDILYQYSRGTAHGNIITVLRDGEPEFWQVNDPMLLESITNLSPKEHHPIMEAYGRISRFMTGNITGRNVLWSIFSNAPRDLMTLFTYSKDKNVFKLFSGIASSYVQRAKGVKADAMYQEYISMGGGNTSAYTADKNLAKSIRKKLTPGKLSWLNPLEWLDYVSDMVEAGPRYSHYRLMRINGMTPQEAFYASMDVTVNFRRGGSQSRALNNFVPFFNAGVQGLDKFSRWVTAEDAPAEKRKAVVAKRMSAYIAASSILGTLMWFINSRDDDKKKEYAQLSNYTKNNFFCIPLGKGKYFTIPKPREIAVLSSFIETCIERYANDNPDAFDEFYDYATDMFMPSAISNLAQGDVYGSLGSLGVAGVASYMMANRDFLGKPIESNALRSLEPKDRYTNRTSKIAYWAGQAFNTSPTMIDYFFQQTLGGFWKAQKALFPVGSENIDYTLGVQGTYVRDNQYSTDLINRLYDGSEKAAQKSKSHSDDVKAAMTARQYDRMTAFYGRYSKLSKGVATTESTRSTRQTVLNMVNEFNKTMESGYRTEEQAALDKIIEQTGDPSLYPAVMSDQVKDYDGVKHPLTAEAYVEYQTNYNDLYWQYAEIAMNDSKIKDKAMGLEIARSKAADKALENALAKMSIHPPVKENIVPATSITVRDDIVYQAALKVANKNGGGLSGDEIEAAIDAMPWLDDEEKAYLYQSEYKGSVIGNPYATTDTLKEYIRGKLEDGAERSSITREVTSAYKPAIVSLYEAGEKRAMKEAIMKLQSLGLQDKDGDQYYSTDRIIGWIEKK